MQRIQLIVHVWNIFLENNVSVSLSLSIYLSISHTNTHTQRFLVSTLRVMMVQAAIMCNLSSKLPAIKIYGRLHKLGLGHISLLGK